MCVKKVLNPVGIILIVQLTLMSCSGGFVSQNGIFEDGHKELKESLIGSWRIMKMEGEIVGQELYEFYREDKAVALKVNGMERSIERFDSTDGLSFTFEYLNGEGGRVFVAGQFKTAAKQSLVLLEEPASISTQRLYTTITLERRSKHSERVVASSGN